MKKIYENIDYLELKILGDNFKNILKSIVLNSPEYRVSKDVKIVLRSEFMTGKYLVYDVYYSDTEILNKDVKVASINWIKAETSKSGVFITFPGLPFVNYGADIVYYILDSFGYDYEKYLFQVYRLDFCNDFENMEVQQMSKGLNMEKLKIVNIPIRYDTKTKKSTWFILPFCDDKLRVYNKKLDISDRKTFIDIPHYKEYSKNKNYITRVEIQLGRNKFKKKFIKNIDDLFLYGQSALYKKLNKYFNQENLTQNVVFEKDIDYIDKSDIKEYEHSVTMFKAYTNKLIANPYGRKYLIKQIKIIEKSLYPNKIKVKEIFI